MYYLKLFDENLLSFEMDNKFGLNITNIELLSENTEIFPIRLQSNITPTSIEEFIASRIIPKNRAFVQNILESAGLSINDKKSIIDVSKGLSLTDSYWVVRDPNLKFADYNLYDNDFSKVLSLIAFTGYTSKIKELITSPELSTNGMLPKAWRKIDGQIYLYKGSTESYRFANTGYEPYSEFYASQVAQKMGISHVDYNLSKWKNMLSSTCKLFTDQNTSYVQIGDLVSKGGIIKVHEYIKSLGYEEKFSDMILFDAVCMNVDRHFGNFGLLRDNRSGQFVDFAPVFDNGESLLCKAMPDVFENKKEFANYIFKDEVNVSFYGIAYDDLIRTFCTKKQIPKLRKLFNFRFEKHTSYNLPSKRLDCLGLMIRERAKRFITILEEKDNS